MASPRCHRRATHAPPNTASLRGLQAALAELYADAAPLPADVRAEIERTAQQAPYRKRQGDLSLVLPEAEG